MKSDDLFDRFRSVFSVYPVGQTEIQFNTDASESQFEKAVERILEEEDFKIEYDIKNQDNDGIWVTLTVAATNPEKASQLIRAIPNYLGNSPT